MYVTPRKVIAQMMDPVFGDDGVEGVYSRVE
jgi:hypothetical protein